MRHQKINILLGCVLMAGSVWGLVAPLAAIGQEMESVGQPERDALVEDVVMPFLEALQTGNAPVLEQLIGGKLATTLGKLLRQNTSYPDFLRQRYRDTTVQETIQIVQYHEAASPSLGQERRTCQAEVHLQTQAGRPDHFRLHLEQDALGVWKIIDKIMVR